MCAFDVSPSILSLRFCRCRAPNERTVRMIIFSGFLRAVIGFGGRLELDNTYFFLSSCVLQAVLSESIQHTYTGFIFLDYTIWETISIMVIETL